jgi:NitT/TauT family transport system substrate-binding protein
MKGKTLMTPLRNLAAGFFMFSAFLLPAASATAADTGKLIFGQTPPGGSLQSAQVAIALEKNLFKEVGLDVEIVRFPSGRRGLEAIIGGQIDLAYMAEYPPAIAALQKQDFAVITQLGKFVGNRIIGRSDLGFESLKDIAGKRIGTSIGTNAEFFTQLTLEKAGVQAEIVNINPPDIIAALDRGDIQIAIPFPDYYDKAREALGSRYREVVSKDYESYNIVSASGKILKERPGDVKKFLMALIKADDIIRNNPADAKATILAASQGALNAAIIDKLWPEYQYRLGFDDAFLDLVAAEAKWLELRGIIKGASIDRAGLRGHIADGPITSLAPDLNKLSK